MKKFRVEFGSSSRGELDIEREGIFEVVDERELVRESLLREFNSVREIENYWRDWYNIGDIEGVIDFIIGVREEELEMGIDEGYILSEERFFRVVELR